MSAYFNILEKANTYSFWIHASTISNQIERLWWFNLTFILKAVLQKGRGKIMGNCNFLFYSVSTFQFTHGKHKIHVWDVYVPFFYNIREAQS